MASAFAAPQRGARTLRACLQSAAEEIAVLAPKPVVAPCLLQPTLYSASPPFGSAQRRMRRGPNSAHQGADMGGLGFHAARSDAGLEIMEIISHRREESGAVFFGSSPPTRSVNPVIHDRSFSHDRSLRRQSIEGDNRS